MATGLSPVLRWAGGKQRLADLVSSALPADLFRHGRFIEPFAGGAAIAFALADSVPGHRLILNDANPELVNFYRVLRDQPRSLITAIDQLAQRLDEDEYYQVRARHRGLTHPVQRAAAFFYLNRTCFNGLWRVNKAGEFNVAYGKLKKPKVRMAEELRNASHRLQGATILEGDAVARIDQARRGDTVYLDPPYVPRNDDPSFTDYTREGFSRKDHQRLAAAVARAARRGVHVLHSNRDAPDTWTLYQHAFSGGWAATTTARRSISRDAATRGDDGEALMATYPLTSTQHPDHVATTTVTDLIAAADTKRRAVHCTPAQGPHTPRNMRGMCRHTHKESQCTKIHVRHHDALQARAPPPTQDDGQAGRWADTPRHRAPRSGHPAMRHL